MRVQIHGRHLEVTLGLRAHGERAVDFALGRFGERVDRVRICMLDINGPRGGIDKCCRITVQLRPSGMVYLEETGADLYAALNRAVGRAGRAVGRRLHHDRRAPERRRGQGVIVRRRGGVVVPLRSGGRVVSARPGEVTGGQEEIQP
jgi:putative sigma-54 modulation protein